jgi:hypothetical protein
VTATLTNAVAVANRIPQLIIDNGTQVVLTIPSNVTLAASLANVFNFADSMPYLAAINGQTLGPLPSNLMLGPGWRIRSSTTGIQAADQWSAIALGCIEWFAAE